MNQFPIAEQPSKGPMLGIMIIVILIILGGIYILSSRTEAPTPTDYLGDDGRNPLDITGPTPIGAPDNQFTTPPDLSDLEAEAGALETDLQNLDQEAAKE